MTIIPVSDLSRRDMQQLGHNVSSAVRRDRRVAAINRSLAVHGERVKQLLTPGPTPGPAPGPAPGRVPANGSPRCSQATMRLKR